MVPLPVVDLPLREMDLLKEEEMEELILHSLLENTVEHLLITETIK